MALIFNLHYFLEHGRGTQAFTQTFTIAPPRGDWTRSLPVDTRGPALPGEEKPFPGTRDMPMMPQIYEDVVLRAAVTPTWCQKYPEDTR